MCVCVCVLLVCFCCHCRGFDVITSSIPYLGHPNSLSHHFHLATTNKGTRYIEQDCKHCDMNDSLNINQGERGRKDDTKEKRKSSPPTSSLDHPWVSQQPPTQTKIRSANHLHSKKGCQEEKG
ncbi:hypothetical protein B0T25DRAFT_362727 [Lasiosphaeria hispida]|uniref:Secreted protein n=1 Tax=Lasiosphaeria hispida TaxID=260671 RepID=A0AAJ0M7K5_9PEZI|nr:hypothetical protein B0T25DRAFT_362727 [Lasiosphaeria hispida]